MRSTTRRRARARRQPPARWSRNCDSPASSSSTRYSPGGRSLIVSGVVPLGFAVDRHRRAAAGAIPRPARRSPTAGLPSVAGVLGRGPPSARRRRRGFGDDGGDSRTSSERDGRALVSTMRALFRNVATPRDRDRARAESRSRSANGVTPRATPSTSTLAPLGVDRTKRRPIFVGAVGCAEVPSVPGAWCLSRLRLCLVPRAAAPHLRMRLSRAGALADCPAAVLTATRAAAPCSRRRNRRPRRRASRGSTPGR